MLFAQRAIATLFDAVGQIFRDMLFQATQQQRAQLRRKLPPRDALRVLGIRATFRLVRFQEVLLRAEITGLDEINNAP